MTKHKRKKILRRTWKRVKNFAKMTLLAASILAITSAHAFADELTMKAYGNYYSEYGFGPGVGVKGKLKLGSVYPSLDLSAIFQNGQIDLDEAFLKIEIPINDFWITPYAFKSRFIGDIEVAGLELGFRNVFVFSDYARAEFATVGAGYIFEFFNRLSFVPIAAYIPQLEAGFILPTIEVDTGPLSIFVRNFTFIPSEGEPMHNWQLGISVTN